MKLYKITLVLVLLFPLSISAAQKPRAAKGSIKKGSIKLAKTKKKITSIKAKAKPKKVISAKPGKAQKAKGLAAGNIALENLLNKQKLFFEEIAVIAASEVVKTAEYLFLINRDQMVENDVAYLKQYQKLHPGMSLEALEKVYKKNAPSLEKIVDAAIKKQFADLIKKYEASYSTEVYTKLAQ